MNRFSAAGCFIIRVILVSVLAVMTASGSVSAADFVSIFDGSTLNGWAAAPPEAASAWSVQEGVIVGEGAQNRSYLVFENHDIADFELKLSYRFPGEGNSGISLRAVKDETGRRDFQSYHADLGHVGIGRQVLGAWDFHTPGRTEHRCWRGERLVIDQDDQPTLTTIQNAVTTDDIHKGEWNDALIIARGNRFSFYINGKLASEFTEHLPPEKRLRRGMIQLQLHDPGMIVQFRDIQIRITD